MIDIWVRDPYIIRVMPIIKAAIKHLRQSEKHRRVNRLAKDRLKQSIKDMVKLAKAKKIDEFKKQLPLVISLIDKAAKNNLIHKNNAAHKKSRLAHLGSLGT
ncbi:30S ribosomal protein S20 [Candidatus Peregrinibacteria bacterium]|nr:30S ribosomal protein S20 [Candidatus Peregrinibacteria bacterium]